MQRAAAVGGWMVALCMLAPMTISSAWADDPPRPGSTPAPDTMPTSTPNPEAPSAAPPREATESAPVTGSSPSSDTTAPDEASPNISLPSPVQPDAAPPAVVAPPGSVQPGAPPPVSEPANPPPSSPVPASPPGPPPIPGASAVQSVAPETAEAILGQRVTDSGGKDLGRLVDVLVDANAQPQAAVIDFGGFMGVGNRKIAVHWSALHFNPGDPKRKITLEMTPDQIKAAPEFLNPNKAASVVTPAEPAPASP